MTNLMKDSNGNLNEGEYYEALYFITCPTMNAVKIGRAKNPKTRAAELNTASPCSIFLDAFFWIYKGAQSKETELHRKFKHLRYKGEWFHYDEEIKCEINSMFVSNYSRLDTRWKRKPGGSEGAVYFVQCEKTGLIKMGVTDQPKKEIQYWQSVSPTDIKNLGYYWVNCRFKDEMKEYEESLREELSTYEVKTKWYRPEEYVLNTIRYFSDKNMGILSNTNIVSLYRGGKIKEEEVPYGLRCAIEEGRLVSVK